VSLVALAVDESPDWAGFELLSGSAFGVPAAAAG
jgi:hypothetical protein